MKISIACSDPRHPVVPHLLSWQRRMQEREHSVALVYDVKDLGAGDVLFLVSCAQIVGPELRARFSATLVLHASDLPRGRGWSPHVWAIVSGSNQITVSLIEAADPVDSGAVWLKERFTLDGHELLPEINEKLFACELSLMSQAVERFGSLTPTPQQGDPGPYLRRRTPEDSRLDAEKSLAAQFDLLRACDSARFPAFVELRGHRYLVKLEKVPADG